MTRRKVKLASGRSKHNCYGVVVHEGPEQSVVRWSNGNETCVVNDWIETVGEVDEPVAAPKRNKKEEPLKIGAVPRAEPQAEAPKVKEKKNRGAGDDLSEKLKTVTNVTELKALAERNEVWDDKYLKLPNFGVQRMNVGNRLRARVKRGVEIQW